MFCVVLIEFKVAELYITVESSIVLVIKVAYRKDFCD